MDFKTTFGDVEASYQDGLLKVTNDLIERCWKWTDHGLVTTRLISTMSKGVWNRENSKLGCDWLIPGYDHDQEAELKGISAHEGNDEGFTSKHLEVVVEIHYPKIDLDLRYTIGVYPGISGMRTQLSVKAGRSFDVNGGDASLATHHRVDFLPTEFSSLKRRMFGYYNETQQRNDPCEDILKEEVVSHPLKNREFHTWPSAMCLEDGNEGLALVKESHKCPNQPGYDCGLFVLDESQGMAVHGWGLGLHEIDESWRDSWASWCLVYENGVRGREEAFKAFDSARYPLDLSRDVYVQANTWGSGGNNGPGGTGSRDAAVEDEVLKELDSVSDLGIDVLQIDDGWQVVKGSKKWMPDEDNGWHPHPECYPSGWKKVRSKAKDLGVKIGLWAAAQPVSLEELEKNYEDGGFLTYKLDFADLSSNQSIRDLMQKVRSFIKGTGHKVRVNWDVTEVCRRYGYFFAREYGCLYLSNRKPVLPASTTYRPNTMLRDLWQLSRYINIRKIQASIQNVDMVNSMLSDAKLHPHDYCVAITLMSTPLFFQQTYHYDEDARKKIRPLLCAYKEHQAEIFQGVVIPIGSRPDNYSWTGFQSHNGKAGTGYLTIFRELNSQDAKGDFKLEGVSGCSMTITDVMKDEQQVVEIGPEGEVSFSIEAAPGYLFLRYDLA